MARPVPQDMHQCPEFGQRLHGIIIVVKANDPRLSEGALKDYLKPVRDILRKTASVELFLRFLQRNINGRPSSVKTASSQLANDDNNKRKIAGGCVWKNCTKSAFPIDMKKNYRERAPKARHDPLSMDNRGTGHTRMCTTGHPTADIGSVGTHF
ncbi:hypothetical protein OS493_010523 [Desmophyllum pertusum]|uniref:Uncharacterized protein n=1 Tax=Desmophyllum pertusum TaxID=174260 RepID=A0A9X0DA16_9CNID|nr:hypothetical protein OS493_010523 [Desmophyllum pertusum]